MQVDFDQYGWHSNKTMFDFCGTGQLTGKTDFCFEMWMNSLKWLSCRVCEMYHETAVTISVVWAKTNAPVLHIFHYATVWLTVSQRITTCSCCRRAEQLMAEDNDDAIPYCIATGDIKKLVTFFTGRGQLLEAVLIAQVQRQRERGGYTWKTAAQKLLK